MSGCVLLPKLIAYVKNFDDARTMSSLIEDEELLKRYNIIWNNVKSITGKKSIVNKCLMKNI